MPNNRMPLATHDTRLQSRVYERMKFVSEDQFECGPPYGARFLKQSGDPRLPRN